MHVSHDNQLALSSFSILVERYCILIESLHDGRKDWFYRSLEDLLAGLHIGILQVEKELPSKEHRNFEKVKMTKGEFSNIANMIRVATEKESAELIKWHENIGREDEPCDDNTMTRVIMLWDDLADIYHELKNGLSVWKLQSANAMAKASWEWRFGYESHWGHHLLRAMTTVHEIRYRLYV